MDSSATLTKSVQVIGPYTATTGTTGYSLAIPAGSYQDQTLTYTNIGTATWSNSGPAPVKLGLAGPLGRGSSRFKASTWTGDNRISVMNEASVAPSHDATFNVRLRAPMATGTYTEVVAPVAEGVAWVNTPVTFTITVVPATYSWQIVSQSYSTSLNVSPGQSQTVTVVAKNTSNVTWYRSNPDSFPIRLGTSQPTGRTNSLFYDGSWLARDRPAGLAEASVAPGANGTFTFRVNAPGGSGEYHEGFSLVAEGAAWFNDPGMYFTFRVGGSYSWQVVSQSYSNGNTLIAPLGSETVTLVAKNTGTATWLNNGPFVMKLGTNAPRNRGSRFYAPSWADSVRPAVMAEASVAPGANGTFSFVVTAPAYTGHMSEAFNLVAEGLTWLNDPGMYFDFIVQ